jgi:hypothetical protein
MESTRGNQIVGHGSIRESGSYCAGVKMFRALSPADPFTYLFPPMPRPVRLTAQTLRSAEPPAGGAAADDEPDMKNRRDLKRSCATPPLQVRRQCSHARTQCRAEISCPPTSVIRLAGQKGDECAWRSMHVQSKTCMP